MKLTLVTIIAVCFTLVYTLLFISLWEQKEWVGISLLALLILAGVVHLNGTLNEQAIRRIRFRHQEEIPLDAYGEAQYLPPGASENSKRQ